MPDQKIWFFTGASYGFGRLWAEAALPRGDKVAATARSPKTLEDLAAAYGDAVLLLRLDVDDGNARQQPSVMGSVGERAGLIVLHASKAQKLGSGEGAVIDLNQGGHVGRLNDVSSLSEGHDRAYRRHPKHYRIVVFTGGHDRGAGHALTLVDRCRYQLVVAILQQIAGMKPVKVRIAVLPGWIGQRCGIE